jgi:hypothetical protein
MVSYDRKQLKSWAKSKIPFLVEKRIMIAAAIVTLALLFVFSDVIQAIFVMALFIVLGFASMMYNRWIKVSLGVELIMLGTVITAAIYGSFPAIIVGFTALFAAEVFTNRFTYSTFISFVGLFIVAILVPTFETTSITWIGIWMTILYDAIILPGYLVLGSSPLRSILFLVTHLMFNIWLFIFVAPFVFRFLT